MTTPKIVSWESDPVAVIAGVEWLVGGSWMSSTHPWGRVSIDPYDLVVISNWDDWRDADGGYLAHGGVLLGPDGTWLVAWTDDWCRLLPSDAPALPWCAVEPPTTSVLQALIQAVPSEWDGTPTDPDQVEGDPSDIAASDDEWVAHVIDLPVPADQPPATMTVAVPRSPYRLIDGGEEGAVVMRTMLGLASVVVDDDWWSAGCILADPGLSPVDEECVAAFAWGGVSLERRHPGHPAIFNGDCPAVTWSAEVGGELVAQVIEVPGDSPPVIQRIAAPCDPAVAFLRAAMDDTDRKPVVLEPGQTRIITDEGLLRRTRSQARPHRSIHHLSRDGTHIVIVDHGPLLPTPSLPMGSQHSTPQASACPCSATLIESRQGEEPSLSTLWWTTGETTLRRVPFLVGSTPEGWCHSFIQEEVDPLVEQLWRQLCLR
ncbi:hypothetical protein [Cutibacterium sp.]|uniref:hypothetical protein n=1 Tax=Cutibacterium sp. TaxID=1912221 RepID=UPI0026DB1B7D|nr:hypothetical protein [Cutibacterium sp.]MDO4413416.1 hypothetical protein [Cutibacterium sp.]